MDSHALASLSPLTSTLSKEAPDPIDLQQALDRAIVLLKTGDFQTQWDVAKVIPTFGESAIVPLLEMLEDDETETEVLWFVARLLGQFNHPATVAALIQLLRTAESEDVVAMAATTLTSMGESAIAPLTELLESDTTRTIAVQALAQTRHPDSAPPLLTVCNDPSPAIRAMAIEAISHLSIPETATVLIDALQDRAANVRRAAVIGLGFQANVQPSLDLVAHLKPMLWDFNLDVCRQAALALGRIGNDEAAIALFEVLRSPNTPLPLQIEAIRALVWIESATAFAYLQQHLESDSPLTPEIWHETITVLGRVKPPNVQQQAAEILLNLLQSDRPALQSPTSKQAIALSLGQLGQIQALDALIQLLADADTGVQLHAIAALKQLNSQLAHQRLATLAEQDLGAELRRGVAIALQEWNN